jgi:ATP phosphoribosyltransferase
MTPRDRLRIAVQKSGRLAEPSQTLLAQCGLKFRQSRDKLFCYGEGMAVDLLLVRDDDIPGLIAEGVCDLGIVGRNVLAERSLELRAQGQGEPVQEVRALGFGGCRLSIAVPQEMAYAEPSDLEGTRIATSYPQLLADWLSRHGVHAQVVVLNGSVEIAPRLGTAELICDLVSSGATLVANQLREAVEIIRSEAVLASTTNPLLDERGDLRDLLLRRLDGVLAVKDSRLVMLHAPRASVAAITRVLPGSGRPTIMPLADGDDDVAVQAVCTGAVTWQHLEEMQRLGARSMLVVPVERMLG